MIQRAVTGRVVEGATSSAPLSRQKSRVATAGHGWAEPGMEGAGNILGCQQVRIQRHQSGAECSSGWLLLQVVWHSGSSAKEHANKHASSLQYSTHWVPTRCGSRRRLP